MKNEIAAKLRACDACALADLKLALQVSSGSIGVAAQLIGLAGASSLWRIAYGVAEVRQIISEHGRARGRPRIR